VRARLEHFANEHAFRISGQGDDPDIAEVMADLPRNIDAAHVGQRNVEHENVRTFMLDDWQRFFATTHFPDNLYLGVCAERPAQSLAKHPVIVGEDYA
jgi:hypothetical protein